MLQTVTGSLLVILPCCIIESAKVKAKAKWNNKSIDQKATLLPVTAFTLLQEGVLFLTRRRNCQGALIFIIH